MSHTKKFFQTIISVKDNDMSLVENDHSQQSIPAKSEVTSSQEVKPKSYLNPMPNDKKTRLLSLETRVWFRIGEKFRLG